MKRKQNRAIIARPDANTVQVGSCKTKYRRKINGKKMYYNGTDTSRKAAKKFLALREELTGKKGAIVQVCGRILTYSEY